MATQFLESTAEVSNIINPGQGDEIPSTPSGHVLIAFYGTMESDEKWQIEQADAEAQTLVWVAVHATDFLDAQAPVGTSVTTSQAPVNLWEGPRNGNRVFEVPVGVGNLYRVRLVYKSGSDSTFSNTTVTASWTKGETKIWA